MTLRLPLRPRPVEIGPGGQWVPGLDPGLDLVAELALGSLSPSSARRRYLRQLSRAAIAPGELMDHRGRTLWGGGVTIRAPEPLAGWARLWAARALSDAGWRVTTPGGDE